MNVNIIDGILYTTNEIEQIDFVDCYFQQNTGVYTKTLYLNENKVGKLCINESTFFDEYNTFANVNYYMNNYFDEYFDSEAMSHIILSDQDEVYITDCTVNHIHWGN